MFRKQAAILAVMLGFISTASADVTTQIDIKAHYSVFVSGTTVDLPVYFVENRDMATGDESWVGTGKLSYVGWNFEALGSEFVSFTPIAGFDKPLYGYSIYDPENARYYFITPDKHNIYVSMQSTNGIPVTVDNSGITGRTEIFIGTLRVKVGPAIRDGNQWLLFDMKSKGNYAPSVRLPDGAIQNWNYMANPHFTYYADEPPREDKTPPTIKITRPKASAKYPSSRKIRIRGTAADNEALVRWEYKLNKSSWKFGGFLSGKSASWNKKIGKVKAEKNTIRVRAYDSKGLISKTAKRNVRLKK